MNQLKTLPVPAIIPTEEQLISTSKPFIEANTIESSLEEMRTEHIIPVFVKDNETLISHVEFIESVQSITYDLFRGETILHPAVRLSHPIKGRIPEAKEKQAKTCIRGRKLNITRYALHNQIWVRNGYQYNTVQNVPSISEGIKA